MLNQTIQAVYRNGAFVPTTPCELQENATVELMVRQCGIQPPAISDPEERKLKLLEVTESMLRNPLPPDAPRFSRDDLHERR